jgi:hypothetical protein
MKVWRNRKVGLVVSLCIWGAFGLGAFWSIDGLNKDMEVLNCRRNGQVQCGATRVGCTVHGGPISVGPEDRRAADASSFVLGDDELIGRIRRWEDGVIVSGLGVIVFTMAFWGAVMVRAYRWGRRYNAGSVELLPTSWVLGLSFLFAPAGMLAMGCFRQAVWQVICAAGILASGMMNIYLVNLVMLAWTAIARYRLEN